MATQILQDLNGRPDSECLNRRKLFSVVPLMPHSLDSTARRCLTRLGSQKRILGPCNSLACRFTVPAA